MDMPPDTTHVLSSQRDFLGYGQSPPDVRWPGGADLAVSFVLNVEEGAEFSLSAGDPYNEDTHEVRHRIEQAPDLCMESHFEYGARAGYWRIMRAFEEAGIPITLNVCARGLLATPWVGPPCGGAQRRALLSWISLGKPCRHERRPGKAADCGLCEHLCQRRRCQAGGMAYEIVGLGPHAQVTG